MEMVIRMVQVHQGFIQGLSGTINTVKLKFDVLHQLAFLELDF